MRATHRFWIGVILLAVFSLSAATAFAQKKRGEENTRSVQGTVTAAADDSPVAGAVVQLKNTKTLQIRSFITKDDGTYHFYDLSPDIDYQLKADYQGSSSSSKTLSSFDSRKQSVLNLKLNPKK